MLTKTEDDVRAEMAKLGNWYHTIELAPGLETPGRSPSRKKFETLLEHLPDDLAGARVLDVGSNAGGLAVEFARAGAEVIGAEVQTTYHRQATWVADVLGLDNFTPKQMGAYDLRDLDGRFDIVLYSGLLYHLRYPQLALDIAADKCRGSFFLTTPKVISDAAILELRLPDDPGEIPPSRDAAFNWWYPSERALSAMMSAAGFTDITKIGGRDTAFASSDPNSDNVSAYPTGTIELMATGPERG